MLRPRATSWLFWLLLSSCAGPVIYPQHELSRQILSPRPGHTGLVNRACAARDSERCTRWLTSEYSLEDPVFRDTANRLNFVCNVGGKRYRICRDKPGLCRIWFTDCGLFCSKKRHEEYLPASGYQFLLDANTVCFNETEYDLQGR
jgi:hypothetical protein